MVTQQKVQIPKWASCHINQAGVERVEAAVSSAELKTSGEIVPIVVRSCSHTDGARRNLFLLLLSVLMATVWWFDADWTSPIHLACEALAVAAATFIAFYSRIPGWLLRILVSPRDMKAMVEQRAELEFYRCRVHHTEKSTGIILFLSLAEHRAVVLGDQAIASKLPQSTWDEVLKSILDGAKQKNMTDGLCGAIEICGDILSKHFPRSEQDRNELHNHLVFRD